MIEGMDTCPECLGIGLHFEDCSRYDASVEDTAEAIAASQQLVRARLRALPTPRADRYHPHTTVALRTMEGGTLPLIAYVCADCGVLVVDKAVHDQFHEDQK